MLKSSYRLLLLLLLIHGAATAAPAAPTELLFKVISSSPTIPADSYSTTCTINNAGRVDITRDTGLFKFQTSFKSVESKIVKLNVATLRKVINDAAKGHVTGLPIIGGGTYQYFAYQIPVKGATKEVLLLDKKGGMTNDSPLVEPLSKFIDGICGNVAQ